VFGATQAKRPCSIFNQPTQPPGPLRVYLNDATSLRFTYVDLRWALEQPEKPRWVNAQQQAWQILNELRQGSKQSLPRQGKRRPPPQPGKGREWRSKLPMNWKVGPWRLSASIRRGVAQTGIHPARLDAGECLSKGKDVKGWAGDIRPLDKINGLAVDLRRLLEPDRWRTGGWVGEKAQGGRCARC